jgi:protein-tyrosine phosphatase
VALPSGAEVWAVSFEEDDPYGRDEDPDFGLYFDEKWAPPWSHACAPWPDFGAPVDHNRLHEHLSEALARAKAGDRVEIGCWGAHGRTGTALGCLAILDGHAPHEAVAWVRENYCERAIETPEQEAFVTTFGHAGESDS